MYSCAHVDVVFLLQLQLQLILQLQLQLPSPLPLPLPLSYHSLCTLRLQWVVRVVGQQGGGRAHTWRTPPAADSIRRTAGGKPGSYLEGSPGCCTSPSPPFLHCNLTVDPSTLPSAPEHQWVHSQTLREWYNRQRIVQSFCHTARHSHT